MKHIVSFSGGKDSTAMLLMMLKKGMKVDDIIFIDTTKEFPAMYKHIEDVENMIQRPISKLKFDFDYWFKDHIKLKGKNIGKQGYGWPDAMTRWCTFKKRDTKLKFYKDRGYAKKEIIEYVGIAKDEGHRLVMNSVNDGICKKMPLYEWGITEAQALDYCYSMGFDWNGLYKTFNRVSCYLCPLSRINELRAVFRDHPLLWKDMLMLDGYSERRFRPDYTLLELDNIFLHPEFDFGVRQPSVAESQTAHNSG